LRKRVRMARSRMMSVALKRDLISF